MLDLGSLKKLSLLNPNLSCWNRTNQRKVPRHDVKRTNTERFFFSKPLLLTLYPNTKTLIDTEKFSPEASNDDKSSHKHRLPPKGA